MTAVVTSVGPSSASAAAAIRGRVVAHFPSATMRSMAPRRARRDVGRDGDVVAVERERVAHVGEGDRLHEGALGLGVGRDELLLRRHLPHPVHDAGFGRDDELLDRPLGHRADHPLRRGDVQSLRPDVAPAHLVDELARAAALRMHQDLGVRVLLARGVERLGADPLVHVALAQPHLDPPVRPHPAHVGAEEEVGEEEDALVRRDGVDHVEHVAAGAAVVELRLHVGGRVDVAHRDVVRELRLPAPDVLGGHGRRERAAGLEVGQQHPLRGRQNRRGLRHEVDAREDDHLGRRLRRLAGEAERVAHEVGDVLDLGPLVVVGDDDRVPLLGQRPDLGLKRRDFLGRLVEPFDDGQCEQPSRGLPLEGGGWIVEPAVAAAALAAPAGGFA